MRRRRSRASSADSKVLSFKLARRRAVRRSSRPARSSRPTGTRRCLPSLLSVSEHGRARSSRGRWRRPPRVPSASHRRVSTSSNGGPPSFRLRGSDDEDHWFRHVFDASGAAPTLRFDGLATVCDVYLDGALVLQSESMFVAHELPVPAGPTSSRSAHGRSTPLLAVPRKPRARWRSRVPRDNSLRWFRTSLLGRAPGLCSRAAGRRAVASRVGRWNGRRRRCRCDRCSTATTGSWRFDATDRRRARDHGRCRDVVAACRRRGASASATSNAGGRTPTESLISTTCRSRSDAGELTRAVGLRELGRAGRPRSRRACTLQVNGVPVFVRGVVWTPVPGLELRSTLVSLRDAGLNLIRVVGTTVYESAAFHDLCDELGLLVWQDLMFANMDYPFAEPAFRALVEPELRQALGRSRAGRAWRSSAGTARSSSRWACSVSTPRSREASCSTRRSRGCVAEAGSRRDIHPVRADRRRAAVPDRSRRRELLRRRRVPPAARGCAPRRCSLRVGMPRLRERPGCRAGHVHRRRHARRRCRLGLRRRARSLPRAVARGRARPIRTTGNERGSSRAS